jgi:CheY-like chemotaxis protein
MAKILVIDDELFYRETIREALEKDGHRVISASNSREGLDLLKQGAPDVALVDIILPGSMDGLAILFKIKSQNQELPVIMLSAYEDKQMILTALRRGAFDYLTKPISPQELTHVVGKALERYQLIRDREDKLAKLTSLEEGSSRLSQFFVGKVEMEEMSNAYQMLETTLELVGSVLEADRVSIMLVDPAQGKLKVVVSKGFTKAMAKTTEPSGAKKSVSGWVLQNKKAVLVKDVNQDERFQASEYASYYKTNSFVIAPLIVGDEVVGTINANNKRNDESFTESDLMLLKTFSHQVALTLQYLQAMSELGREKTKLMLLADLEKILLEERDPGLLLTSILRKCQEMMDVNTASIFLKDEFTSELMHKVGWEENKEMKLKHSIRWGEAVTGRVASEAKTVMINDTKQFKNFPAKLEWPKDMEIKNYLASPVKVGHEVIGVIRLINRMTGGFKKRDMSLLEDVARSMGIALRDNELYRRLERSVEETILANQMLRRAKEELEIKNKELELLKKKG